MEIDSQGNVTGHEIAETVIRSDRRMTYTAVECHCDGSRSQVTAEYAEFAEMFLLMKELADILRKKRHARGSIDFDFPESKIVLDEKGKPLEIKAYERNAATRIIEDFMLLPMRRWRRTISGRNCPSSTGPTTSRMRIG